MSNIMKGIVDESEEVAVIYIDGKPAAKYARKHEAERDAEFMRERFPNKKIEIKQEVRESVVLDENLHKWFKEKWVRFGPDGKIRGDCARGDDSEGKPKCLPQKKAHALGKKGRKYAASKKRREDPNPERRGKAKNVATKKKTNEEKCPHCGGELVSEEMMNEKQDACYRKVKARYKVWPSAYASGALVQCRKKGAANWGNKSKANEGVIVGHDANDPEVAVLGGAGTMSLSRLKKKAQGEAEQLANDLARGRFKAAAYNIKQLENTLNTIVAAEKEMEKKYFGEDLDENAWNQLGQRKPNTNLPAPDRGSRVNHGKRFEEGDIVLPLSGPLKGQPHKVIHSQRTSIRIVPLGRNTYPGDTIAPRTKHEWVVPADMNEDYTGEVVKKVFKHKGKPVGEIGVDLASSPGGGMYYMKYYGSGRAVSGYDSMEEAFAELKHYLNQMKEGAIGDSSPYQEGYNAWKDYLAGKTKQRPVNPYPAGQGMGAWEKGAGDAAEHLDWDTGNLEEDYTGEFAAEKTPAINPYGGQRDIQHRGAISETPTDNPTGASGEGGWRRTDLDEYREMSPALKAAQQNLIALRNKEKAVNVPGKRERAPRDKVELDKPKPASVLTKGAQEVDPDTMDAIAAFLAKGGEIKKGRPGKAPPVGRSQASKHIGGGGKYRKKSDTPGQGANYRGAAIVAVEEDTAYATGGGKGGNAGESYRKFKPKSAGTFKEDAETKWEVAIEYGPTAHHTAKIKVSAPDSDTAQSKALAQFKKKFPDRRGMVGDCTKVNEEQLDEKCWDGYKQVGMKKKGDKMVPNCVAKESSIMKGLKR